MSNAINILWSLPFGIGLIAGAVAMRLYLHLKCRWQNKHHPNPDGTPHKVPPLARQWLGGLIAVAVVVYVLAQGQQTHDRGVALTERFGRCTSDLIVAIDSRGSISAGRDDLSEEQRHIFGEILAATDRLINGVISPPPEIAATPPGSTQRAEWVQRVRADYDTAVNPLLARSAEIDNQVAALRMAREQSQLPSPRCNDS
ncbi:membrane protein [Mycobacterium phage Funsized]|nr:membrane protein [Mycobacterium phage Funsized]